MESREGKVLWNEADAEAREGDREGTWFSDLGNVIELEMRGSMGSCLHL